MNTCLARSGNRSRQCATSAVFLLLLVALPLTAWGEDEQSIATLRRMGKAFASIAETASPAVVGIQADKQLQPDSGSREPQFSDPFSPFDDDLFEYFFGPRSPRRYRQPPSRQVARGSGFIISTDGYILTNNHLVGGAEEVTVSLADGETYTARIIGTDPASDVAVVKIDKGQLPHLKLADSDALEVGEWVIAIGNPFGLSHTVTAGIVSAKGRSGLELFEFEDFIQTDAAINPGNSGGPLLNLDGEVVGINTAIYGPGGNIGIGLAIPISMAKGIYQQLISAGEVKRGFLGVLPEDVSHESAVSLELPDTKGAIISQVTEGSAADKAGLKPYDVVVEFNGAPVENANDFRNKVALANPGAEVSIVVIREGKRKKFTAVLEKREANGQSDSAAEPADVKLLGFEVGNLTQSLAERLGYEQLSGVVVTGVTIGSEAYRKGIKEGLLITEADRKNIKNTRDFGEAVERARSNGQILLRVTNGEYYRIIGLKIPNK